MAQPTFFLQPLAAAISLACFSSVVFAAEADSAHILAPIVVTAQQGNDAHGHDGRTHHADHGRQNG